MRRRKLRPLPEEHSDGENEIWSGTRSPRALYCNWSLTGILGFALTVVLVAIPQLRGQLVAWILLLSAILLAAAIQAVHHFWQRLSHWYILTDERLLHRDGILVRTYNVLELIRIDDVTYEQGPLETLFGVGCIFLSTSDSSHPELELRGIEDVSEIAEKIDAARRLERKKRGIHVEAI